MANLSNENSYCLEIRCLEVLTGWMELGRQWEKQKSRRSLVPSFSQRLETWFLYQGQEEELETWGLHGAQGFPKTA